MKKTFVVAILVILLLALSVSVAAASGGGSSYHTVRWGETLFSIGRLYGVNPYSIADVNGIPNPNCIYSGQVLYIPTYQWQDGGCWNDCGNWGRPNRPVYDGCDGYGCDGYGQNYHIVARGETLTSIAYYYGVSVWALANANHIYDPNRIHVGQRLHIPSSGGYYYSSY